MTIYTAVFFYPAVITQT